MPYKPPAGKGHEGVYDRSIGFYWSVANTYCKPDNWPPNLTPLQTLAFAYTHFVLLEDDSDLRKQVRKDALTLFPDMASEF